MTNTNVSCTSTNSTRMFTGEVKVSPNATRNKLERKVSVSVIQSPAKNAIVIDQCCVKGFHNFF